MDDRRISWVVDNFRTKKVNRQPRSIKEKWRCKSGTIMNVFKAWRDGLVTIISSTETKR